MKNVLLIAISGMLGTLCRYGITAIPWGSKFPYATAVVNMLGTFLAGFCHAYLNGKFPEYSSYFPILFIGFFGAFTTFSTFMLDSTRYLCTGHYWLFALNILGQVSLGLLFAVGGFLLAKSIL